ncbi:MAG: thioredoxin domain-containing protein, partial [Candidatus Kryptonium sp.]
MIQLFWDDENGGFYFTEPENADVIFREKEIYDGAIPSGNSVALLNLLKLWRITGREDFYKIAQKLVTCFAYTIKNYPSAYTFFLLGLDFMFGPSLEIIIVARKNELDRITEVLNSKYIPNKIVLFKQIYDSEGDFEEDDITTISPLASNYKEINGKTTIYICTNYECKKPITEIEE